MVVLSMFLGKFEEAGFCQILGLDYLTQMHTDGLFVGIDGFVCWC